MPTNDSAYIQVRGKPDPHAPAGTNRAAIGKLWVEVHRTTGALRFVDRRYEEEIPLVEVLRKVPAEVLDQVLAQLRF
jgi:hypothetical protein